MTPITRSNIFASILFIVGCTQMTGYTTGSKMLRGIGAASVISPSPKVFCVAEIQDGQGAMLETFSSQFSLVYTVNGARNVLPFDPKTGHLLRGPYNRRNVYGAALSYAPCLPRGLVNEILHFGLRPQGDLRRELGIPVEAVDLKLIIRAETDSETNAWEFPASSTVEPPSITPGL